MRKQRRHTRGLSWFVVAAVILPLLGAAWWAAAHWPLTVPPARQAPPQSQPPPAAAAAAGPFDLILSGGTVVDGTGAQSRRADVGVRGDRIAFVGDLTGAPGPRLDVTGLTVAPGFINPHSHTYEYDDAAATAAVMQGITTELGGVDGRHDGDLEPRPTSIGAALAWLEQRGTGVNQGLFAGFGTIRRQVVSAERSATAAELAQMQALMRQAMDDGAFGLSTGLEYPPDREAAVDEIVTLARVAAQAGGVYDTHVRQEGLNVLAGVAEAIQIGKAANIPVAVTHLKFVGPANWPRFEATMARLREAAAGQPPVVASFYPYLAPDYATGQPLQTLLQVWEMPERTYLRDPAFRHRSVAALAAEEGVTVADFAARHARAPAVVEVMRAEHVATLLREPFMFLTTDDQAQPRLPPGDALYRVHPRGYGSYPLALQQARDLGVPIEMLIRRLTGAVAAFLQVADRGEIRPGAFADIVVFAAADVAAEADWWDPQAPPRGIQHVLVNGAFAVRDGRPTGALNGRALRRDAAGPPATEPAAEPERPAATEPERGS